ncbi:hypothetical protein ACO2Q3_20605 [Caulobacter sp. KR2-114]|uniref:hypothetical protein n=1 Tax=Caulobacter sp. KR2-114 TaxID=3400912 RepID=UPI003C0F03C1
MDDTPRSDLAKPAPKPASAREQKLAAALRANLRRRKAPPARPGPAAGAADPES